MEFEATVLDASRPAEEAKLRLSDRSTVKELYRSCATLALPSAIDALQRPRLRALRICYDGRVLEPSDKTLRELNLPHVPVLVLVALDVPQPTEAPRAADAPHLVAAAVAVADAAPTPSARGEPQPASPPAERAPSPRPPSSPPPASDNVAAATDEGPTCRICFSAAFENGLGKLISPCMCLGSMRYVHAQCLHEWREQSTNQKSYSHCEQCGYKYELERNEYAHYLEDRRLTRAVAALMLACFVAVGSLSSWAFSLHDHFYRLLQFNPRHAAWEMHLAPRVGLIVQNYWGPRLDGLVCGLLLVGCIGLCHTLHSAWQVHRHDASSTFLFGLFALVVSHGRRILRVLLLLGLSHSVVVASFTTEAYARRMLTRWGTKIREVQR